MLISFSGTSGSGKSTIITKIKNSKVFKGRKVIVREEDSFIFVKLSKIILGDNFFSKYKEEKFFEKKYNGIFYKLFSVLSYIFYPIIVYIEYLIDFILYQIILRETVLIEDRFIYDYSVTFRNVLKIDNWFAGWLYNHFPHPHLSFLIDINLDTALLRNKNNIPGKITAKKSFHKDVLSYYRKIANKNNLLIIDNNASFKDTVKNIVTHIDDKERLLNSKEIAICGLDGGGKTTVANMLAEYARSLNIRCKVVHFYHENLLFKFLRLVGYYKMNESNGMMYQKRRERSARERLRRTPFILALLRFSDSYIQYLFSKAINRDKLVVFDRYFYDYLASFEYLNIKPRLFFSKIIPSVKNRFLFESSPVVSYRRKPESIKEFFIQSHKIYLKVAKEQNIKVVNTERKEPKAILEELIDNIN